MHLIGNHCLQNEPKSSGVRSDPVGLLNTAGHLCSVFWTVGTAFRIGQDAQLVDNKRLTPGQDGTINVAYGWLGRSRKDHLTFQMREGDYLCVLPKLCLG